MKPARTVGIYERPAPARWWPRAAALAVAVGALLAAALLLTG